MFIFFKKLQIIFMLDLISDCWASPNVYYMYILTLCMMVLSYELRIMEGSEAEGQEFKQFSTLL